MQSIHVTVSAIKLNYVLCFV